MNMELYTSRTVSYTHLYEINSADNLIEILGELLGTTAVSGRHSVNDKFYEETGCQEIPGLVIINHDRI